MITWITGDVFDGLATLEDGSVDLVVTSPPFLALRSYLPADHPDKPKEVGSEATPAEFLDTLLEVTAELRRVLAPHGSICVELGDTYAGSGESGWERDKGPYRSENRSAASAAGLLQQTRDISKGWPLAKSKTLIPELYRIALAYGFNPLTGEPSSAGRWRVRNVVTWCRPNPPVGALGDKWRPATSDIVVACTSSKRFWDDLATRKATNNSHATSRASLNRSGVGYHTGDDTASNAPLSDLSVGAPLLDYWEIPLLDGEEPKPYGPTPRQRKEGERSGTGPKTKDPENDAGWAWERTLIKHPSGAPLLDYWEIPPTGYAGAHYAVYPPALVEPLVKAMCPEKVCRTCGEPSRREIDHERTFDRVAPGAGVSSANEDLHPNRGPMGTIYTVRRDTLGFTDCGHDDWRPGIVLDPFAGSGTTLAVASGHGHDTIGFDLDPRNEELARERVGPLMWETV